MPTLGYEWALLALGISVALVASSHALLNKRDPRAAWGWIIVCWLFPLGGSLIYFLFGINRLKAHAQKLRPPSAAHTPAVDSGANTRRELGVPASLVELVRTADALTHLPLVSGNSLEILHNGEQAYPAMLASIDLARHSVAVASYIFDPDRCGEAFADALGRAHARGVEVRVLLDGYAEMLVLGRGGRLLRRHDLPVMRFHPPGLIPPSLHVNLRNHRKLLIIDGVHAFTGGMNISDRHLADDPGNPYPETDIHFALTGPVVAQLLATFLEDWRYASGETWNPPAATIHASGVSTCRVIADGPNESVGHLAHVLFAAIAAANHHVRIMTPYFLPSRELSAALEAAALRGVTVEVLLPAATNHRMVRYAMLHGLPYLIDAGVRVYRRPQPFAHGKLFMIDDDYAQIGSANFDPRSLRLNFELNVEVYDPGFSKRLTAHFDAVRAASEPISAAELRAQMLPKRLRNAFCWLFSPLL